MGSDVGFDPQSNVEPCLAEMMNGEKCNGYLSHKQAYECNSNSDERKHRDDYAQADEWCRHLHR